MTTSELSKRLEACDWVDLHNYIEASGRGWRRKLAEAWDDPANDNHGWLRRVRNAFGPSGLYEISTRDIRGVLTHNALSVVMLTPALAEHIRENDPKAFEQAEQALGIDIPDPESLTDYFERICDSLDADAAELPPVPSILAPAAKSTPDLRPLLREAAARISEYHSIYVAPISTGDEPDPDDEFLERIDEALAAYPA